MPEQAVNYRITVNAAGAGPPVDELTRKIQASDRALSDLISRGKGAAGAAAAGGGAFGPAEKSPAGVFNAPGFGALFGAGIVARTFESLGQSFQAVAQRAGTFGQSLDTLSGSFLRGLPIIGAFFRGAEELFGAFSGVPGQRAGALQSLALSAGRLNAFGSIQGVRTAAAGQLAGFGRLAGNAGLEAAGAAQLSLFAGSPFFDNPLAEFGAATGQEGTLRFGVAQAQAAAIVARQQAAAEEARFAPFQARADFLAGRVEGLRGEAGALGVRSAASQRALANAPGFLETLFGGARGGAPGRPQFAGGPVGAAQLLGRELSEANPAAEALRDVQNEQQKLLQLKQREAELGEVLKASDEQRKALADARNNAAQAGLALARAELELKRNELDLAGQRLQGGRSIAAFVGSARPGEAEAALRAFERVMAGEPVSDQERASAMRFGPSVQAAIFRQDVAGGRNSPITRRAVELAGGGEGGLGGLEEEFKRIEGQIRAAFAKMNETYKAALSGEGNRLATDLAASTRQFVDSAISKFRAELGIQENPIAQQQQGQAQR